MSNITEAISPREILNSDSRAQKQSSKARRLVQIINNFLIHQKEGLRKTGKAEIALDAIVSEYWKADPSGRSTDLAQIIVREVEPLFRDRGWNVVFMSAKIHEDYYPPYYYFEVKK